VDAAGDARARVGKLCNVTKKVNRGAPDRRQENMQIKPGHEFRKHAGGLFEQRAA
jgi:hypothetical protein